MSKNMQGFGMMIQKLKESPKRIVFTEGTDERILEAASVSSAAVSEVNSEDVETFSEFTSEKDVSVTAEFFPEQAVNIKAKDDIIIILIIFFIPQSFPKVRLY